MKIFYAVQATGNGHISRASTLYPYLQELGEVDFLLSGSNASLSPNFPVKYKSKGISLFYSRCGSLNYAKSFRKAKLISALKDSQSLPLDNYDLIINDFDFITSYACRKKGLNSVQFGHQASFQSENTPRPSNKNWFGEWVLKSYARAEKYVGLHFRPYENYIFPPVIKDPILEAKPADQGHITVYLPAYHATCIRNILLELSPTPVHWFLHGLNEVVEERNITYFPVSDELFNESLIHCHGLVTGGGFETPSEALFLKKKLLSIPIIGQYEQQCNSAALNLLGVPILKKLDQGTKEDFFQWVKDPKPEIEMPANEIRKTLNYILALMAESNTNHSSE